MDKTILKEFAIDSRNKLIKEIKNRASMIGITEEGIEAPLSESTSDMLVFDIKAIETYKIYGKEVRQYEELVKELEKREENSDYSTAYETLVEEVAYTWFNRLIAIRFMEVNNYMPDRIRVLSSGIEGVNEPEIVTNYTYTSLDLNDEELEQLSDWQLDGSNTSMEKMFRYLFIKQCNALNDNLPELFEKTDDYAELLLTISYNDKDGVLYKLVHEVPEDYFDVETDDGNGQVEIIGWLYQYYNSEKKDEVINIVAKKAVDKEDIPAATQLFTTDWVVRYMVDNSLGKYWLERNPDSSIKDSLEYLMPGEIDEIDEEIAPKDLKILDNAMGSGHCLIYAFDVLLMIYESKGYTSREAAKLIIENNLYGLDIDKRAYQLAYFAVMMKARQYNRSVLDGGIKNNILVFEDSTGISRNHLEYLGQTMDKNERKEALNQVDYLIEEFTNAREIGSILVLEEIDIKLVSEFINDGPKEGQIMMGEVNIEETQKQLEYLVKTYKALTNKYDVIVTNPPYLNKMSPKLKKYVNNNYKDYKKDLFSVFIYRNLQLCKLYGYSAYMTPFVWMFIKTYEKLREYIINKKHISTLIQMEYSAFEEATVPICTFVLQNNEYRKEGKYIRLSDFKGGMEKQRIKTLEAIANPKCDYYYETNENDFELIPGRPIAYWVSDIVKNLFDNSENIGDVFSVSNGMFTCNNKLFLKKWYEVKKRKITLFGKENIKWYPYNKGGDFRKWYGNREYIVNYKNNGNEIRQYRVDSGQSSRLPGEEYFLEEFITWSDIGSSGNFAARFVPEGSLFDIAGSGIFRLKDYKFYLSSLLNTKISSFILNIYNPTLHFQIGNIRKFPIIFSENKREVEEIKELSQKCIYISKKDWDSFETSWDFVTHPLVDINNQRHVPSTIELIHKNYKAYTNNNFNELKKSEERLNELFIEIYGLGDELAPELSDKDITVTKIFDHKDDIYDDIKGNRYILTKEDVIKSFISYAVGCMFGRYSLDEEGLTYAGGEWDSSKYKNFKPVEDNVILITDEEYFENGIVNRFVEFVKVVYGEETLEENLEFIADSLTGQGTSREKIRNYFLNKFFKDHVKTYKKTPIYWLYDSSAGKYKRDSHDGFKALIYMHRYDKDTTGKVRIDYLHKLQKEYEFRMDNLQYDIDNNKNAREVAASEKKLTKLTKQLKETKDYDEKIAHLALARIPIDLDDGVKVNYEKVQKDEDGNKLKILAKI